jgi:hypothetical protein
LNFNTLGNAHSLIRKVGKGIFEKTLLRSLEFKSTLLIPSIVNLFNFCIFGKIATNFLRDVFWEAMDERMKSNAKRGDLLDFIIELRNNEGKINTSNIESM